MLETLENLKHVIFNQGPLDSEIADTWNLTLFKKTICTQLHTLFLILIFLQPPNFPPDAVMFELGI